MGFHSRISSLAAPSRMRAGTIQDYNRAFFSGDPIPDLWLSALSSSGVQVTPELARTLSAMYCGVSTIAYDLATLPAQTFKYRSDGGKDRIRGSAADWAAGGIGDLAYMLQWAPNDFQTATEFFAGQVAQFLMRGVAYAEIVDGPKGFLSQLLPRHPDRVTPERLASGRIRYKLIEANGQPRYVSQEEMHVVRDISTDPLSTQAMTTFASNSVGVSLSAERAAGKFFKSGMTAAMLATYAGDKDDEQEDELHKSITRFAGGVENSFGLMLVPDDIKISNLAVEPDKAQMMQCVAPGTLISMADGTRRVVESIRAGEEVIGWDNGPVRARVANVWDPPEKALVRLTTARGRTLTASYDHPVLALRTVKTPGGGPAKDAPSWIFSEDLRPGMHVRIGLGSVPISHGKDSASFDQGWFLGAMTGDGSVRKAGFGFTSCDTEVVDKLKQVVQQMGGTVSVKPGASAKKSKDYYVLTGGMGARVGDIRRLLNAADIVGRVAATKRVPDLVYCAGPDAWRGFLSGYLDTDGTVQPDRKGRRGLVSWTSVSRQLLDDCQHLLALLGVQSAIYKQSSRSVATIAGRTVMTRGTWQLVVVGSAALRLLASLLVPSHSAKSGRLQALLDLPTTRYRDVTVLYDRVVSVETLPRGRTIGLEIEGVHTHITNGIVTHNSREWTVFEVARWLRISPRKLMVRGATSGGYASAYQDAIDHVVGCIRPLAHTFEQAIQRDLILAKDTYFVKFDLKELLRGDPAQMGTFIEQVISSRAMTPSEVRMDYLDKNPDDRLDKLSESDNQPGKSGGKPAEPADNQPPKDKQPASARANLKAILAVHDNAVRCLRRERVAVEKLGRKHAADADGWKVALRDFYADHAVFVAQTMRLSPTMARGYAAQHGTAFEAKGLTLIDGDAGQAWEAYEADELAALSLSDEVAA